MFNIADIKSFFGALFNSYADVFFIRSSVCGVILCLLTFTNINAGISGLLSVLSAYFFALLFGYQKEFLRTGYITYNSLLVGLSIGFLFQVSPLSLLMVVISGAMTLIFTLVSSHSFNKLFGLQTLSVPFIIVSSLIYLSAYSFSNLYVNSLYVPRYQLNLDIFHFFISGYLKSLGAILFMPNEVSGLVISALLLYYSRILFLLSFAGFSLGVILFGLFTGSIETASQDISSFNYLLIAMALGGVFNIPSLKSYFIAFTGVAMATLIASAGQVFWSQYGLPIFTLPFTLITLSFIYALTILKYPLKTEAYIGSPEDNLDYFISNKNRFPPDSITISLPFLGTWYCWQGFNGSWTHRGFNQYAYDFVICDATEKTYTNQGIYLTDYYCYGKEVLSPVNGRIIRIVNHLADNVIGSIDSINYWGNEVLIQDNRGFFIKIAHFANASITVVEGQTVYVGTLLGLCGNSGNSPQPHIHIQVQESELFNAPTTPFIFVNYAQDEKYNTAGLPEVKKHIYHCHFDLFYDQLTNFVLDDIYQYEVFFKNQKIDQLIITVKMADSLTTYFATDQAQLYFGKQYGNFYMYSYYGSDPYLKLIYLALSTMPISFVPNLKWQDKISNALILNKPQQMIASILNSLHINWVTSQSEYHYINKTTIAGLIKNNFFKVRLETQITLDPNQKISQISIGDYQFKQIPLD